MIGGNKMTDLKLSLDFELQRMYRDTYFTKRLELKKTLGSDLVSIVFEIFIRGTEKPIGEVVMLYDGEIWCKIEQDFAGNGYATEAVRKLMQESQRKDFYLSIKSTNFASKRVAKKLGFVKSQGKIWKYQ